MTHASLNAARARHGFTLIELLVVIAIIALLLALTGAGLQKAQDSQRRRSTDEQLTKLQQALDREYDAVVRQCARDRLNDQIPPGIVRYCAPPAEGQLDRAQSVWTALQLRHHFPETYSEALTTIYVTEDTTGQVIYTMPPLATFQEVNGLPVTPDESAVLLYIILSKKAVGQGFAADEVTSGQTREIDFSGRKVTTFKDAWGNSVGFRRWEQNAETDQAPYRDPKNAYSDPLDPRNYVNGWPNATKRDQMAQLAKFNGRNRVATVFSAGKNRVLDGLAPGTDDAVGYRLRRQDNRGN
jgi:prepilin-type N-terminal cleavage/methylation domain-containing protein